MILKINKFVRMIDGRREMFFRTVIVSGMEDRRIDAYICIRFKMNEARKV